MIPSVIRAFGDVFSAEFRAILFKAFGITIAIFAALLAGAVMAMRSLSLVKWGWVDTLIDIVAGLGLVVALFLLMAPVTALFAGLYLDEVAAIVEQRHYPQDRPGAPLPAFTAVTTALSFGIIVLLVNIAMLPALFFGIGAIVIVIANAYLLSREYFEMVAMRHMSAPAAKALRRAEGKRLAVAGLAPALLALVPVVSLAVPLFATSYFTHIFKRINSSFP
jgi:CysZ protein